MSIADLRHLRVWELVELLAVMKQAQSGEDEYDYDADPDMADSAWKELT